MATCGRESNLRPNARLPPPLPPAGTSYTTIHSCHGRATAKSCRIHTHIRVFRYKLHIPTTYCSFYYCVVITITITIIIIIIIIILVVVVFGLPEYFHSNIITRDMNGILYICAVYNNTYNIVYNNKNNYTIMRNDAYVWRRPQSCGFLQTKYSIYIYIDSMYIILDIRIYRILYCNNTYFCNEIG